MEKIRPAVRINTRISARANDWLTRRAEEMALTKSALINLALEDYIRQSEVIQGLPRILEELERQGIKIDV